MCHKQWGIMWGWKGAKFNATLTLLPPYFSKVARLSGPHAASSCSKNILLHLLDTNVLFISSSPSVKASKVAPLAGVGELNRKHRVS
eukprot:6047076-Amphidinium_carterae.1